MENEEIKTAGDAFKTWSTVSFRSIYVNGVEIIHPWTEAVKHI